MKDKPLKKALNYISKLFSTALLIVLLIVGLFLVYYLISAKMVSKNPEFEPKINLYTIVSGSMEPNIRVYDVILDYKVNNPEDLKIGDVITFKSTSSISKGLIVTHRIIDIKEVNGKVEYVTKGDWNSSADSDTAKFDNIIGKVIMKFPQLGRLQFFLATKMGWFIVVLLPAMCVIIYDVIKLIRLIALKKSGDSIQPTKPINEPINDNVKVNIKKYEFTDDEPEKEIEENYIEDYKVQDKNQEENKKEYQPKHANNNRDYKDNKPKKNQNNNNNQNKKQNNNSNNKKKKNKNKKNDFKNDRIINDTLENIKKSDYMSRLNNLRDYENRK